MGVLDQLIGDYQGGYNLSNDVVYGELFNVIQDPSRGSRRGTKANGGKSFKGGDIPYVPEKYEAWVMKAARKYGVNPALIGAVGQMESGWQPNLGSSAGAQGLMQTMPFWSDSPDDPMGSFDAMHNEKRNIMLGTQILRSYLNSQGSRRQGLAAYNAGPGNIGAGMDYANEVLALLRRGR